MNPYNRNLAENLIEAMDQFVAGDLSLSDIQARLQSAVRLFENEPDSPIREITVAGGDLEEIQFARLIDEQGPATIMRLDELRGVLVAALSGACGE